MKKFIKSSTQTVVIIDNYDSFTYNLVQIFGDLGATIFVFYHDEVTLDELKHSQPTHLCISPGPGTPQNAKISLPAIEYFFDKIPILGVCLGHQCLIELFGGKIEQAQQAMHGKTSKIFHQPSPIFEGVPKSFLAMRYHSLIANSHHLPSHFNAIAYTEQNELMAVHVKNTNAFGIQFHPESILTPHGKTILKNFLNLKSCHYEL